MYNFPGKMLCIISLEDLIGSDFVRRCYGKFDRKPLLRFTRESFPDRIFTDFCKESSPRSLWGKAPRSLWGKAPGSLQGRSSGTVPWKVSGKVSEKLFGKLLYMVYSF